MTVRRFLATALLGAAVAFSGCKKEKSNENDILEFWVNGVEYVKSGANFTKFFPKLSNDNWGNDFPATLVAPSKVVISPKASISPAANVPQEFEKGVTYTVTAENGAQRTFTVTAQRNTHLD